MKDGSMIKMDNTKFWKTVGYWLLNLTWGSIMTAIGLVGFIGCMIVNIFTRNKKVRFYKGAIVTYTGHYWGGVSLGPFLFIYTEAEKSWHEHRRMCEHEWGHTIQNIVLGPLNLFLVCIPSFTRYWYREVVVKLGRKHYSELPPYDSIWFEGQATAIGAKYRMSDDYWTKGE